ncbi:MAG: DUF4432 family protein [Clostridia bacterium]|nr:DUF4432 family protein [Clostridia bacterium]
MAKLFGKEYTRRELEARVGTMKQIAYVRQATLSSGREDGVRIAEMRNGPLTAVFAPGRCLDMISFSYRGVPMNFSGKCGLVNAGLADGTSHPLQSVNGGMFYTCGLTNVGNAYGTDYFHGQIRLCPADRFSATAAWEGDDYLLRVSGEMHQSTVCGENLSLIRTAESKLGERSVLVKDTVRNDGFSDSPFMLMYHLVFGFPLLDEDAVLVLPVPEEKLGEKTCALAVPTPEGKENGGGVFPAGKDGKGESVFCLYQPKLSLGLKVRFSAGELPLLCQWKSMQSGDYALGIMPSNCDGSGRQHEIDQGTLKSLKPGETRSLWLELTAVDGEEEFALVRKEIGSCI